MRIVFISFLFWLIAESFIVAMNGSIALLFILPICAGAALWYLSRQFNVSVLAGVHGGIFAVLLFFFPVGAAAHGIALAGALLWYALARATAARRFRGVALISFIEVIVLYLVVLAWHVFSHASLSFALPMIGVGTALIFFNSITVLCELGMWMRVRLFAFSLGVGVVMAELFFVTSNLPLHIANIDFLLFFVYYVLWDVTVRYFSIRFTMRSLAVDTLLLLAGFGAIFFSVRWLP